MDHSHCNKCFYTYCTKSECPVVYCKTGCHARLHECKTKDHTLVCPLEVVSCINAESGCTMKVVRYQMSAHLSVCPAYVVICCFQWVRKMLQDSAPNHSQFLRRPKDCSRQLDLALTFFDQKRGNKKLLRYTGKKGIKACQDVEIGRDNFNYSYSYNPAHPAPGSLQWYRTSTALGKPPGCRRPPYMTPVPTFLQNCAAYTPPAPLHWTKPMFLIANKLPNKVKVHIREQKVPNPTEVDKCLFGSSHEDKEVCARIEPSFSCYNIIAINNLPLLHRSEASLHLSCGQMLRRDQVSAHADTVHNRIMAGIMDGWMIERCPLSAYGCEHYQIRIQPKGGKQEVKFDDDLGVFYLRTKEELPAPTSCYIPQLPAEIWCLIGQYCDSYTLAQLCSVSFLHHTISAQLLQSRGLAHKRWTRGLGPRLWDKQRKVISDDMRTLVSISCSFAACKRWEPRPEILLVKSANWGITASLTNTLEWELADNPHISIHMNKCPWNVRTEHRADLAQVYGHPIIDPSVIIRNF
ncbi:F-box only protein 30-like isoform X1 [Bolinopsis microptera]|uniref:F-box only protein 30-like isoform X1 n=1 Tax=Bolinopsis microptera TaxID=2820187 RepID=UPI003079C090